MTAASPTIPPEHSKQCPQCKKTFTCRESDIKSCFCNAIALTHEQLLKVATLWSGCLCQECLLTLSGNCSPT